MTLVVEEGTIILRCLDDAFFELRHALLLLILYLLELLTLEDYWGKEECRVACR